MTLVILVVAAMMFAGCGRDNNDEQVVILTQAEYDALQARLAEAEAQAELQDIRQQLAEVTRLTWAPNADTRDGRPLETDAGIIFTTSSNHSIGPENRGDFVFMRMWKYTEGELETLEGDWELFSSHEIIRVRFFTYTGDIIGTQQVHGFSIIIDSDMNLELQNGTALHKVVVYVRGDDGRMYSAEFARSGK